jgi:hypothetical protein
MVLNTFIVSWAEGAFNARQTRNTKHTHLELLLHHHGLHLLHRLRIHTCHRSLIGNCKAAGTVGMAVCGDLDMARSQARDKSAMMIKTAVRESKQRRRERGLLSTTSNEQAYSTPFY